MIYANDTRFFINFAVNKRERQDIGRHSVRDRKIFKLKYKTAVWNF